MMMISMPWWLVPLIAAILTVAWAGEWMWAYKAGHADGRECERIRADEHAARLVERERQRQRPRTAWVAYDSRDHLPTPDAVLAAADGWAMPEAGRVTAPGRAVPDVIT